MSHRSTPNGLWTNAIEVEAVKPLSPRHIAFVSPLILLHLGCGLVLVFGISLPAIIAFVVTGTIQLFGITAGYHRLLAHRSFKTSRQFQFVLVLFGVLAGQNGPLWWVGHHRHHHRHSDGADDTHSPRRSFFWSHMGWLFSPSAVGVHDNLVRDLARCAELVLLQRYSYVVIGGYALLLYFFGEAYRVFEGDASGGQIAVWGIVVSTVFVYHAVWSANSFCHRFGSRRYVTGDDSRNNPIVSLLTLGDGWHHNHHACPYSARHGFRWWELDINFALLKLLSWCGIVWDLRLPPKEHFYRPSIGCASCSIFGRGHQRL